MEIIWNEVNNAIIRFSGESFSQFGTEFGMIKSKSYESMKWALELRFFRFFMKNILSNYSWPK